ncbi:MAG TPA: hypothetical protein VH327_06020 [Gammaproteobacteria bacterium]|jgi:hypothetical protein|nr:hypothetical protein [Gammaproteobacteria bacterium]
MTHEQGQFVGGNPMIVFDPSFVVDQATMQFDESKPGVDWGISLVWQGDHYIISADQNITPGKLTQTWQVVAVQDIPLLKQGQIIALGTCRVSGKPDSRVVAIVDYHGDERWFDHFEGAWAYDYPKDAFEPIPTDTLQCLNPRYGLGLDKPPAATTAVPTAATHTAPLH